MRKHHSYQIPPPPLAFLSTFDNTVCTFVNRTVLKPKTGKSGTST